jgi:hypothetical protein
MPFEDTIELLTGVPILVVVPALVELAKRAGLPARFAGLAAILLATALCALADLASGTPLALNGATGSRWLLGGVTYGLAAAGLYSQRHLILPESPSHAEAPRADRPGAVR